MSQSSNSGCSPLDATALHGELDRWNSGLRDAAAALTDDPIAIEALVAAVNGYYWQAATDDRFDVEQLEAILRHIVGP